MAQSTFYFKGSADSFDKALSQVKKSMSQVAKQTVALQAGLKLLSAAVNTVAKTLTNVLGAALKGVVNLVKSVLNTIKSIVTGAFKFIKSALSTLLNWIKRALGTVFDWLKNAVKSALNGLKTITSEAVKLAKKAISEIIDDVQAFADKEYNQIQLKLGLGDSYEAVMKDFKNLVRYTTSGRDELLDVYSTFTDMGKRPEEVVKYARATVYLSNATGRSLSQITRLLLGQEAAGRDLEKVLNRVGVSLSGQEESVSNVERIINTLNEEMTALAKGSLNQLFANIKNDIIAIKENIGYIFSGPVRYVAQKVEGLLDKIAGSNKIEGLADKLNSWFDKIKPYIDKVFDFVEMVFSDPAAFFKALKADINTIFNNLVGNFGQYLQIIGFILGRGIGDLIDLFGKIDWTGVTGTFSSLAEALSSFSISFGLGAGFFKDEDVVEGSLAKTFINAWNRALPDFSFSAEDPWYKNLWQLVRAAWELALKPLWEDCIKPALDKVTTWFTENWPNIRDTMVTTFKYLGSVLGTAINNAIASSDVIRKVLNIIPGVNFATEAEAADVRASLYAKTKDLLPAGWTTNDLTKENLMGYKVGNSNLMAQLFKYATEEISWLRKYTILEQKEYPSFSEFIGDVKDIWNPVVEEQETINGAIVDANRAFREIDQDVGRIANTIGHGGSGFSMSVSGAGVGGGGGISDYFGDNEFKIKPYAKGGLVSEPTLALLGESGPEYVISNKDLKGTASTNFWSNPWGNTKILLGIDKNLSLITADESQVSKLFNEYVANKENEPEEIAEAIVEEQEPWYKKLWSGVKSVGGALGTAFGKTVGFLADNGAFGEHLGGIISRIGDRANDGTLSIWTALGEIIKEFLPYLQKGLEVIAPLFDQAFDILGNAVQILGERIGKMLMPILEAFVPFMKTLADIVIALAPVVESVLAPAIRIIATILQILTGVLDKLMPVFAALGATIQWISDAISWAIAGVINWLASWIPWVSSVEQKAPRSWKEYRDDILNTYNEQKANTITAPTASGSISSATASYNGATQVYITNNFDGSYIVGSNGMKELALIIKNVLNDMDYYGQTV